MIREATSSTAYLETQTAARHAIETAALIKDPARAVPYLKDALRLAKRLKKADEIRYP